jgi:adenylate cyclase
VLRPPGSSAGRRWLTRSGFALFAALLSTLVFGTLAFLRVPHLAADDDVQKARDPARLLEQLELRTYDWRSQHLGRSSKISDEVVLLAVNDDTLAWASSQRLPGLATQPWPREVIGGLINEVVLQGARLVLVDYLFSYLSPTNCTSNLAQVYGLDGPELGDDLTFRALLDQAPGRSMLAFSGQQSRRLLVASDPIQHIALVAQVERRENTFEPLRQVLATRRMAFSIPDGPRFQIWAGVDSKEDASVLLQTMERPGAADPVLRPRTPQEGHYEITPTDLLLALASVEVEGLDPEALQDLIAVDHPVSPLLGAASGFGAVLARPDVDGVVRRLPHLLKFTSRGRTHVLPSLSLSAVMRLSDTRKLAWRDGRLHVGDRFSFPMDRHGFSLVRWDAEGIDGERGVPVHYVPALRVLQDMSIRAESGRIRREPLFGDKIVVLTNTSTLGGDYKPTSISEFTPGGAVLAQSVVNMLRSQGIERVHPRWDGFAVGVLALVGALLALVLAGALRTTRGALLYFGALLVALSSWVWVARYFFVEHGQWVAMAAPALGLSSAFLLTTIHGIRSERRVRDFIFSVLGQSVSPEVARKVASDFSLIRPERREVTVLFSDIEGFTRISEQLAPDELIRLLEEYFAQMTQLVRATGGHLDKFIGDAVMALWNAPTPNPRHAQQACDSALRMRKALEERQAHWEERYGHKLVARAGINTGDAVVGHVGSDLQAAYTAIGDAVNLASRLEGVNKTYGTFILVGEATAERARDEFVFREVDRVRVKGKSVPTRVFELLARKGEPEERLPLLADFEQGLDLYHQGRFTEASELFTKLASDFNDPVSAVYVGRCRAYAAVPPQADWDGVYELKEK